MEASKTFNKKQLIWYTIFFVLYRIAYEIMYATTVSKIYGYSGSYNTPNALKGVLSYFIFFILIAAIPKCFFRVSTYLVNIFFIFTMLPLLSFYWQANKSTLFTIFCSLSFLLVCLICRVKRNLLKIDVVRYIRLEYILLVAPVLFLLYLSLSYGFADFRAIDILRVYEIRSERNYGSLLKYFMFWIPSSLLPCLMCFGVYYKKIWLIVLSMFMQLYLYMFSGNKTFLFSIALILVSYLFVIMKENFSSLWLGALAVASAVACALYWVDRSFEALVLVIPYRLFAIPAQMSFVHYEFFSQNPKLLLCESIFGRILGIESPYSQFSTYMVSPWQGANANTGYLADAYDNGGFMLMIVYSILFALILVFVDMISSTKTLPVFVAVLTYTMIILTDAPLLTTLLTGGFIFNIIFLYIFRKQEIALDQYSPILQQRSWN